MSSNLPPGVSNNDIPGNRPEDIAWEKLHDFVDEVGNEQGYDANTMRLVINLGVSSLVVLRRLGYTLHTDDELKEIEGEAYTRGYEDGVSG